MENKKRVQLGMNPSTASGRLIKDILFKFVIDAEYNCYRCGEELTRETFSIEHKVPWLDSDNPVELFFDLDNISFSHHTCNSSHKRIPHKICFTVKERKAHKTKLSKKYWFRLSKEERKRRRRNKYEKHGY